MKIAPALIGAAVAALALAGCSKPAPQGGAANTTASGNGVAAAPESVEAASTAPPQPAASVAATSAPTPSPASMDDATPIGPLGIARGNYVDASVRCTKATDIFFYDGARVGTADYDDNGNVRGIRVQPVGKVTHEKGGALFIESLEIEVHKLSGNRIRLTIQDDGPPMRRCATGEIPARFRVRQAGA